VPAIHTHPCLLVSVSAQLGKLIPELELLHFYAARDDGGGSGASQNNQDTQSSSQMPTTVIPSLEFLRAGCPSCYPNNSVKALKVTHLKWTPFNVVQCINYLGNLI